MKISVCLLLMVVGCALASELEKELIRDLLARLEERRGRALFNGYDQEVADVYESVRNDGNEIRWAALVYDGKVLGPPMTGTNYDDFLALLGDSDRVYAYIRFETGDEMSRRAKFAFITWIGPSVSPLKKAKVSTDKAFVKQIWSNFGKEILADEISEVKEEKIQAILEAASGAAYGTGKSKPRF